MIGIIGGNGVAATNKLCDYIEIMNTKNGAFRDAHHPEMIIWQATQVPSRSMFLEGRGESFIPGYVEIGKHLKACGCTELCMCCNTAHYAIHELESEIGIPFINVLEEVAKESVKIGAKRVGMMCTDGLKKMGIYDSYFRKEDPNIQILYPNDEIQRLVTLGICNAKNTKRFNPDDDEFPELLYSQVCDWFAQQDVDTIVGGCTDISAVFSPSNWGNIRYLDSLKVLAGVIYSRSKDFADSKR